MSGTYAVAAGVGWVDDGETVTLAPFGTGRRLALAGTAAELWRLAAPGADGEAVVAGLLERFDGDPAEIAAGARDGLAQLVAEGLLGHTTQPR